MAEEKPISQDIKIDSFETEAEMQVWLSHLDSRISHEESFLRYWAARNFGVTMDRIVWAGKHLNTQIKQVEEQMRQPDFNDKLAGEYTWSGYLQKMREQEALYRSNPAGTYQECQRMYCKFTQIVTRVRGNMEMGLAVIKHMPDLDKYLMLIPQNTWGTAASQLRDYALKNS